MKQDIIEIGYCPEQLDEIDYHAWLQGEGVAYIKSVEDDIYLQMPLVRLFTRILELCKDGLKLTPSGYLPNKIVAEVYPLGPKEPSSHSFLKTAYPQLNFFRRAAGLRITCCNG